jgi:hypothetical protein
VESICKPTVCGSAYEAVARIGFEGLVANAAAASMKPVNAAAQGERAVIFEFVEWDH